ncbi:hypothetical protein [Absidia glauca]|uniref:DDE Tnp4 domain-containing protein n=1 Tax=Absidia glauca TaxID=4829 RepID=A0A168LHL9_ABSGL|nr:hypothetical protein [Absidia glauca]
MNTDEVLMYLLDEDFQEDECRQRMMEQVATEVAAEVKPNKKRRVEINRRRLEGNARLLQDYFVENPTHGAEKFRARFRMSKETFFLVLEEVKKQDDYFSQKMDAAKRMGLSSNQKVTTALRMLDYGCSADQLDENLRIGESTSLKCLRRFCKAVIARFGEIYLRAPNQDDVDRLLVENGNRGFSGMLGSLDCMHWEWKNCPSAWHVQFKGKEKKPSIILEAVASYDLWIWYAFFGLPGTLNDINVLDRSHLLQDLTSGTAPAVNFTVNGNTYDMGYYLTDGIYPDYATFVKAPRSVVSMTPKQKLFTKAQESTRKDVERAFGVLQQRFHIVAGPARMWDLGVLHDIMTTCIILHNLIVERQRQGSNEDIEEGRGEARVPLLPREEMSGSFDTFLSRTMKIVDRAVHHQLNHDLMEHLWNRSGDSLEE